MKSHADLDRTSLSANTSIPNRVATGSVEIPDHQIRLAVDNLSEGLALFDADDRMVFCNRRYREINALAVDAIVVGSRFDDQPRAIVHAGLIPEALGQEAQWLANRIDKHRHPGNAFEQQHCDESWIQVREIGVDYAQGYALGRPASIHVRGDALGETRDWFESSHAGDIHEH